MLRCFCYLLHEVDELGLLLTPVHEQLLVESSRPPPAVVLLDDHGRPIGLHCFLGSQSLGRHQRAVGAERWATEDRKVLFNDALNTFYLRLYMEGNVLFNDTLNAFYLRLYGRKCFI